MFPCVFICSFSFSHNDSTHLWEEKPSMEKHSAVFHCVTLTHRGCGRRSGCWGRRARSRPGWTAWICLPPAGAAADHPPSWKAAALISSKPGQGHTSSHGGSMRLTAPKMLINTVDKWNHSRVIASNNHRKNKHPHRERSLLARPHQKQTFIIIISWKPEEGFESNPIAGIETFAGHARLRLGSRQTPADITVGGIDYFHLNLASPLFSGPNAKISRLLTVSEPRLLTP